MNRPPTLADVAQRAGMSKAAVSMILNNRPGTRLSAEASERVRSAAEELGYRPNPAAQSLRLGKTRTIGFVSDQVTITRYASAMISGVLDESRAHGHTVLMAETGGSDDLTAVVQELTHRRVDGLVIGLMAARMIDVPPLPHGVPLVMLNGTSPDEHPSVLPAEHAAGVAVAQHLVERGHRRIGLIGDLPHVAGNPRRTVSIDDRLAGIDEVLTAAGITPVRAVVDDWTPPTGYQHTHRLLDVHPDLTAIIAGNDNVAFGVYQAMAERGLRVAEDVSVISFDDEELAEFQRPGLTTARLPYDEMARQGIQMLLGDRDPGHIRVPMPLIVRSSVRDLH